MSERTVRDWLSRIDKDSKEARDKKIFALWLACHTFDEISEMVGVGKATVSEICSEAANLPKSNKPSAEHLTDFEPPLFNVWKFKEKSNVVGHFGSRGKSVTRCQAVPCLVGHGVVIMVIINIATHVGSAMPIAQPLIESAVPRLLNPSEVAEMLDISVRSLYRLRESNSEFPEPLRVIPGRPRWRENEIVDFLNSL